MKKSGTGSGSKSRSTFANNAVSSPSINGDDVLAFLSQNPDFLIKHGNPDWLFQSSGNDVVNLGQAITRRAQAALKRSQAIRDSIVDITTANHNTQTRIHQLALMICAAQSSDEIITLVAETLPDIMSVKAARLVVADHKPWADHPLTVTMDIGFLPKLTGGTAYALGAPRGLQGEVFRNILADTPLSMACIYLPRITKDQDHDMVLALAGHDETSFTDGHGTEFLEFIAAMLAVALIARTTITKTM